MLAFMAFGLACPKHKTPSLASCLVASHLNIAHIKPSAVVSPTSDLGWSETKCAKKMGQPQQEHKSELTANHDSGKDLQSYTSIFFVFFIYNVFNVYFHVLSDRVHIKTALPQVPK